MRRKIKLVKITERIASFANRIVKDGITPFKEEPSSDTTQTGSGGANQQLQASQLFSMFTADIINEQVVFTR